jgi:hypothetical protein
MRRLPPARRLALVLPLLLAAAAGGQELDVRALKPVDPAVEDTGPLSHSLRDFRTDFRGPLGFEKIYRVPGYEDDLFMRVDGAIYAVFPQSVYASSRSGPVPLIPNGTIFYIGSQSMNDLTALNEPAAALWDDRSGLRIDSRIDFGHESPDDESHRAPGGPSAGGRVMDDSPASAPAPLARYAPPSRVLRIGPPEMRDAPRPSTNTRTIATDATYRAERLRELIRRAAQADEDSAD